MKLNKASHVDHGLTGEQLAHVLLALADRDGFFIEKLTLPDKLGTVPCGLYGPIMGDAPIPSARVTMAPRGERKHPSRLISRAALITLGLGYDRRTNEITVIAGPLKDYPRDLHLADCDLAQKGGEEATIECRECGRAKWMHGTRHDTCASFIMPELIIVEPCVLYTVFGGPLAPREPDDPELPEDKRPESITFWAEHALVWENPS